MSKLISLGIAFFAVFLIGGPIAKAMGTSSPIVGIIVGVIAFFIATALFGGRKT